LRERVRGFSDLEAPLPPAVVAGNPTENGIDEDFGRSVVVGVLDAQVTFV
jgi:hypothetical protein